MESDDRELQPSQLEPESHSEQEPLIEAKLIAAPIQTNQTSAQTVLREPRWLHPTSILFGLLSTLRQFAVAAIVALFLASSGNTAAFWVATVGVLFTSISAVLRYVTLRYSLIDGDLKIDEGLIFRRHRVIPAKRIQNVDLLQNPIHHFFGVAEVRIETAGGSEPEAKLRVLSLTDVETLRSAIFARPTKLRSVADPAISESSDVTAESFGEFDIEEIRLIHTIPLGQLIQAGLISNRGFVLIPIVLGLFYQLDLNERIDFDTASKYIPTDLSTQTAVIWGLLSAVFLLFVLRIFSVCWYVLRFYGYRLERKGDDLRISCGLFTRVSATVPRRRIQFVSMQQTLLGKWFGLAAIRIETAGGVGEKSEDAASTVGRRWFVPVIDRQQVDTVISQLRTGLAFDQQQLDWQLTSPDTLRRLTRRAILRAVVIGLVCGYMIYPWGVLAGFIALLFLIYLARRYARSLKFACEGDCIFFRSGIITRKLSVTFFDKVQSVEVLQSPFDRRWKMATLLVDTAAAGPAQHSILVKYLPSEIALEQAKRVAGGAARTQLTGLK